jgi:hypothetical protein
MKRVVSLVALSGCLSTPAPPDGPTHHWRELDNASQPGKLHSPRMTFDQARKSVVLHGGVMDGQAIHATWMLTETGWTEICKSMDLPSLHAPAFAYDPIGEQLVIAGGSTNENFREPTTDVWTCSSKSDPATWVHQSVALPQAVVGAQLVHDGSRLILVGGNDDMDMYMRASYTTTDLQTWGTLQAASPATFGGASTNITYDARNQRILALKNYTTAYGASSEATNELWQLPNNGGWSLICGPNMHGCGWDARFEASLAHFGETDSVVAIGGTGSSPRTEFAGSWILDNNELIRFDDNDPPARDRAAMVYDSERKRIVLYGGNGRGCGGDCGTTWVLEAE